MVSVTKISYRQTKKELVREIKMHEGYPLSSLREFNYGKQESAGYNQVYLYLSSGSASFFIVPSTDELKPEHLSNKNIILNYLKDSARLNSNATLMSLSEWNSVSERLISIGL